MVKSKQTDAFVNNCLAVFYLTALMWPSGVAHSFCFFPNLQVSLSLFASGMNHSDSPFLFHLLVVTNITDISLQIWYDSPDLCVLMPERLRGNESNACCLLMCSWTDFCWTVACSGKGCSVSISDSFFAFCMFKAIAEAAFVWVIWTILNWNIKRLFLGHWTKKCPT